MQPSRFTARCQFSPWYRWSSTPPTWDLPRSTLARRNHRRSHPRGKLNRGDCGFQNLPRRRIHTIRESTHVTQMQRETGMNVSFCEEQIFKLLSSPPPGSSTLHPRLHSRSQNLFIGSVYRCSNNTLPKNIPLEDKQEAIGGGKKK